jgi:hypothetical protein
MNFNQSLLIAILSLLYLASCTSAPPAPLVPAATRISGLVSPVEAIHAAATVAPAGVEGTFVFQVLASGRDSGHLFLNSEYDYRDQRNLSVDILPSVISDLRKKYGAALDAFFKQKKIAVDGIARRVTIWLAADGVRTNKYYYQTHVVVTRADQIRVLP